MGFLLGAFGKLAAGRRYRELQARGLRVQSRLRRASRDVENMEKQLQKAEQADKNRLAAYKQSAMSQFAAQFGISQDATADVNKQNQLMYTESMTQIEAYASAETERITNYYEALRETQLQPLKDIEDNLQLENDSIKTQIEVAKQDYEACQKMEQDGAQMLKPAYTPGGN